MEIITSHVHLDLDGFASMILAKKLYPNATIVLSGDVGENLKELINFYKEELDIYKASEIKINDISKIIMVDTSNFSRLGKFSGLNNIETIIYDHHLKNEFGANSTLLLEMIFEKNINLSTLEATIALMGIYEDTGNFSFKNTTYFDMNAGAKLLKLGANLEIVIKYVSKSLSQRDLDFMLLLMKEGEILEINHQKIFISFYENEKFYNGIDVLINKIMELEGSNACFIIHGDGHRNSVIGRSTTKKIPVNKILEQFSHGGHTFASSASVKDQTPFQIKTIIVDALEKNIEKGKIAKDIMKSPVKTVEPQSKLKDILKLMSKFGYSGLPIVEEGKLTGIISRRDVEKTVSHGFGNAPARAYMTKKIIFGNPTDSLDDIKKLMVENEISRIPIVDKNKLLGIITRSDLLEGLYNEKFHKNEFLNKNQEKFYSEYIKNLPEIYEDILKKIETVSKERNENCYLVGGIVRDLLLNVQNLDLDIVVEGDAISFGEALSKKLSVKKIVKHEIFKTCILILENNLNIDIASSRIEYYEFPTSLPTVDVGNIKEDLYRRDFTINAMAIKLSHGEFGKLLDYYGGYKDLKEKKIKILHNLSFVEDPTRIIRAIRFAVRYNFDFEEETYNFMCEAIEGGFLNNLSWQRFKNELIIMLKEKSFIKALDYLNDLKILQKINNNIKIDEKVKKHLTDTQKFSDFLEKQGIETWLLYLLIILENLDKSDLDFIFKRFTFNETFIKKYDYGKQIRITIKEKLEISDKNSEIFMILEKIPLEIQGLLYVEYPNIRKKIEMFSGNFIKQNPKISGIELINIGLKPNKKFKTYLNDIFKLQLDNQNLNKSELIELWKKEKREM